MKGFSEEVKQSIRLAQNGYCKVKGCYESINDFHHRLFKSKYNIKLYPLFIHSPFNCVGLCRKAHNGPEKEQFRITDNEAKVYEDWLKNK